MLFSALVSLMLTRGCLKDVDGVQGIAKRVRWHNVTISDGRGHTERQHERNAECFGNVNVTEGRRITDNSIHSKRFAGDWIRSESGLPESLEHGGRHLSLGTHITVL